MFLFKKIVGPLLFPVPICLFFFLGGLFLLWFTRRQRAGKILVTTGVLLFALFSFGFVPGALLGPLEYAYPAYHPVIPADKDPHADVKWVVVLGGGHTSDPRLPVTSQIAGSSLARVIEGVRLHRAYPASKLLLSGGAVFDPAPVAKIMEGVAREIGVSESEMVLEVESKDTEDEARIIRTMVGDDKFIMVTSASHMRRSMALFQKLGMNPIPAPTDYLIKQTQGASPAEYVPSVNGWAKAERAFYEYLGLMWARMRGRI